MIPLGILMIRVAAQVLRAPCASVMPVIVLLCAVGAFATGNNLFSVLAVAAFDGSILPFFSRPVAAILAAMTIAALLGPVAFWLLGLVRRLGLRGAAGRR